MRRVSHIIMISMFAITFIPGIITYILGNNKELDIYTTPTDKEEKYIEMERASQEQLISKVAGEIPVEHEEEALKVHVIMARTDIALKDNDDKARLSLDDMKKMWGNDFNKNYEKIKKAVEDTKNLVITYKDKPVETVYHMRSVGITQDPVDCWGIDIPYMESVESKWDKESISLTVEKVISSDEICERINKKYGEDVIQPYSLESQIQIIERAQGGYVKSVQIGNQLMTGEEFRKTLDLRSSCFVLEYSSKQVRIRTKGLGHGVGLSQYGANKMAEEGKSYDEIIKYFFPKVEINIINEKNLNKSV